jgi:hypothetical protein
MDSLFGSGVAHFVYFICKQSFISRAEHPRCPEQRSRATDMSELIQAIVVNVGMGIRDSGVRMTTWEA